MITVYVYGGEELARVARPVPAYEKSYPIDVVFFGVEAIVKVANALAHLIQQAGRLQWRRAGFHNSFITV